MNKKLKKWQKITIIVIIIYFIAAFFAYQNLYTKRQSDLQKIYSTSVAEQISKFTLSPVTLFLYKTGIREIIPYTLEKIDIYKKNKESLNILKNNPSLPINHDLEKRLEGKTGAGGIGFFVTLYSWDTDYGRVYANFCEKGCSDLGTTWYDAYGKRITSCGGWVRENPGICESFFNTLKKENADYKYINY